MKIVILGASGLIGNGIMKTLSANKAFSIYGTFNSNSFYEQKDMKNIQKFDVLANNELFNFINKIRPDQIINCLGITKHFSKDYTDREFMYVNCEFVKELANISKKQSYRLIHISTDCVFDGVKGDYSESDLPNAKDIYGKSKSYAEMISDESLVIRTSTIGREIGTVNGLLEWFLDQVNECEGYKNAYFTGITATELGKILIDCFIPKVEVKGLYNVGANKISKYDLLKIFSYHYNKKISVIKNETISIDRSLNSKKFKNFFNYQSKSWSNMLSEMQN